MSRRAGLDRAEVVRAAVALVDVKGLEGLTLAALADRLGIRAPSLYNHVAGLDDLRGQVTLHSLRELAARLGRAVMVRAGDDALLALAHAYRAYAHEHPALYATTLWAGDPADAARQVAGREVIEVALAVMASYGLRDDDALHAIRGLRSAMHGFVSLEAAGGFGLPLDLDESYLRLLRVFIAGLHAGDNPSAASSPRSSDGGAP